MAWEYLTKKAQKRLARAAAVKAYGQPSNQQVGQARKVLCELVTADPSKYVEFHERYCTPIDEVIIQDTAERLKPQQSLF